MQPPEPRSALVIAGVHVKSDAYPNVKYKVEGLLAHPDLDALEVNFAPDPSQRFGLQRGKLDALRGAVQLGLSHLRVLWALVRRSPGKALYVPYPAVFVVFLASLLPRRWRPRSIHADAFISLYDTVVNDRALVKPGHPLARLLFAVERRAYRFADRVLVDTELNAEHMASMFSLPLKRFLAVPLSINEGIYAPAGNSPAGADCTVLFIGTFVPLQGVDVIAKAIVSLRDQPGLKFRIIGSGQSAPEVEAILAAGQCDNVHWERGWQSAQALAAEIRQADICLGIFGAGEKAQRVWPLKNYGYMAVGRALITAGTPAARHLAGEAPAPWVEVPAGDPAALAQAIAGLAADPVRRAACARAAAQFYQDHMTNAASLQALVDSLAPPPKPLQCCAADSATAQP